MTAWPRITVVTPSFNQAQFLERTIRSVLCQEYPNLEYIVIDGGSTDGSTEIIRRYSGHLSYFCSERDQGQAHAIRKGMERATGEILCWLNSDDVFTEQALEKVGRYFAGASTADVLNGGCYVIDSEDQPRLSGFWTYSEGVAATYNRLRWYGQDGMFQQSTFWRHAAYKAVGGIDPTLYFIMDLDLFTRLAARGPVRTTRDILACFRLHPATKTLRAEHMRRRELLEFRSRYHAESHVAGEALMRFSAYRLQSLVRKAYTSLPAKIGLKHLPRPAGLFMQEPVAI